MTAPMTDAEIREALARAERATPGPWRTMTDGDGNTAIIQTNHITRDVWQIPRSDEDLEFIAHARTDVPRLAADLLAARAERDEARDALSTPTLAKHQPCGCVVCTCGDVERCGGCGARMCDRHRDDRPSLASDPATVWEAHPLLARAEAAEARCRELEGALNFDALRTANMMRLPQFKNNLGGPAHSEPDGSDWTLLEWAGAMCGESGEASNVAKKFRRGDYSIDNPEQVEQLADEIADTVIYADILAARAGIDLGAAVARKWNKTSAKIGYPGRLLSPPTPHTCQIHHATSGASDCGLSPCEEATVHRDRGASRPKMRCAICGLVEHVGRCASSPPPSPEATPFEADTMTHEEAKCATCGGSGGVSRIEAVGHDEYGDLVGEAVSEPCPDCHGCGGGA